MTVQVCQIERCIQQIIIVACGSSYHVRMVAQYVMENLADIPVRVEYASEFRYRKNIFRENDLVIFISQSGETSDTLAGPEIAVATTKAYSTQLIACYLLAVEFASVRETIASEKYGNLINEITTLPEKMQKLLDDKERIQWFASKFAGARDIFFIGRGVDYAVCLEGSLKLKEISYIHSEAYAAGELKHGTISLIEDGTLVIGVLTQSGFYEKTVSNMEETKYPLNNPAPSLRYSKELHRLN